MVLAPRTGAGLGNHALQNHFPLGKLPLTDKVSEASPFLPHIS